MAQTNSWPDDLLSIATNDVPKDVYAWWSLAHWNAWPPCPVNCAPGYPLYYSPSDPNTNRVIYIDDRQSSGSFHADDDPLIPPGSGGDDGGGDGDGGGGDPPGPPAFGTNLCLYLSHPDSNWNATLTISNTVTGTPYEIIVSPIVTNALPTWVSAGVWPGADGNTTPVPVELPTNAAYYFDARVWSLSDFLSRPSDGQLLLIPSSTNAIQVMINGLSNNIVPFQSGGTNYVLLDETPLYSVNLGYDASDSGSSNTTTYATWPQQNIRGVLGASSTLTNFCLSYNPLTNLDVHGFTALQDLECWHCTNLLAANVTNCPALQRVCLEACDLHGTLNLGGDTNLEQLRAAFQGDYDVLQEIIFGGAGPNIWHLCAHDNGFTNNFDFTQFPSLKEFWFWQAGQSGPLILNSTNSGTNLTSVQVYNDDQNNYPNAFTTADFHGQLNLTNLQIFGLPTLTNLNVSGCSNLIYVDATYDGLTTRAIDSVLTNLDALGLHTGHVALYGTNNQWPSGFGIVSVTNLLNKGWYVGRNPPPAGTPQIFGISAVPGSNSASINWLTDIPSDSTVYYDTNTSYALTAIGNTSTTNHVVFLTGLTTNTLYYFYVASTAGTNMANSAGIEFTTLGASVNTNPIYFVSTSETVDMQISISASATINWYWGDGTNNNSPSHTFSTPGSYTNYVIVSPASAVTGFGAACQGSASTTLSSVSGLTNYPALQDLYFYETGLTNLSLAGCSNLVYLALVGTNPSTNTENQWFNDLYTSEPAMPAGENVLCSDVLHTFYFPSNPGTNSTSASACSHLETIGWTLEKF